MRESYNIFFLQVREPYKKYLSSKVDVFQTTKYNYSCLLKQLQSIFFFSDRKPRMNILIEKEVQKEDEESSRQK